MEDLTLYELYLKYNSEQDSTGDSGHKDFGHNLAELVFKNCEYNTEKVKEWLKKMAESYKKDVTLI